MNDKYSAVGSKNEAVLSEIGAWEEFDALFSSHEFDPSDPKSTNDILSRIDEVYSGFMLKYHRQGRNGFEVKLCKQPEKSATWLVIRTKFRVLYRAKDEQEVFHSFKKYIKEERQFGRFSIYAEDLVNFVEQVIDVLLKHAHINGVLPLLREKGDWRNFLDAKGMIAPRSS